MIPEGREGKRKREQRACRERERERRERERKREKNDWLGQHLAHVDNCIRIPL